jgi:hypothetical protein
MIWRPGVSERCKKQKGDLLEQVREASRTLLVCGRLGDGKTREVVLELHLRRAATNELFHNECIFLIPSKRSL